MNVQWVNSLLTRSLMMHCYS